MNRLLIAGVGLVVVAAAAAALAPAKPAAAVASTDSRVTVPAYTRQDGASADGTLARCSSTNLATFSGGAFRQQNEPADAIDPGDTSFIVASANDYCDVTPTFGDAWQGIYTSTDGGASWTDSLLPGYPGSGASTPFSAAGATSSGDPLLDWDNSGHLFAGGIAFNRPPGGGVEGESGVTPTNGNMYVSTWDKVPVSASAPLGIHYVRTVIVGKGTPSANFEGKVNDKPSLKVDDWSTVQSPFAGNLYVAWTLFTGAGQNRIMFSRSTDSGATFSRPIIISGAVANAQGSDIAVTPNGDVYVFWSQFAFADGANSGDGEELATAPQAGLKFGGRLLL